MKQSDDRGEERALAVVDALPLDRRHPSQIGILRPLVDAAEAKRAIAQYEELKIAIMRDSDKQWYTQSVKQSDGRWVDEKRFFLKKSYWRRVANFFGISLQQVSEEFITGDGAGGTFGYSVIYRAIGPNGLSMESDGMCWNDEKLTTDRKTGEVKGRLLSRHDTRATAHTRAKNRAISDLVAGGEVSAEEINDREPEDEGGDKPVTPVQRNRIANACKLLGRAVPEVHDYEHAEMLLAALTQEYRELQARQKAEQAEQAARGEQPEATPDLADLPMARGGRH